MDKVYSFSLLHLQMSDNFFFKLKKNEKKIKRRESVFSICLCLCDFHVAAGATNNDRVGPMGQPISYAQLIFFSQCC